MSGPPGEISGRLLRKAGPPDVVRDARPIAIHDDRLRAVLDPATPLLRLYDQASFSEGTVWDAPRGRLVWSDIVGRRVLGWYPDGRVEVVIDATHFINGNAVDQDGRLVHCEHGRRCISRSGMDGVPMPFLTHYEGRRFNSPNDVTLAPDGSLWFTDPSFGLEMPKQGSLREPELDHCSVYRYDPATGETCRMADFDQPNGVELSPDGKIVYVSETSRALGGGAHRIVAFDVDDGRLTGRRDFRTVSPGIPDGFAIDRRGWVWTTSGSGIQVFDATGSRLGEIPTPKTSANCAFSKNWLFIAAENDLLAVKLLN